MYSVAFNAQVSLHCTGKQPLKVSRFSTFGNFFGLTHTVSPFPLESYESHIIAISEIDPPLPTSSPTFLLTNPHQLLQSALTQSQYSAARQPLFPTTLMNSFIWKPLTVRPLIANPRPMGLGDSSLKIKSINQDRNGGKKSFQILLENCQLNGFILKRQAIILVSYFWGGVYPLRSWWQLAETDKRLKGKNSMTECLSCRLSR